MPPPSTQPRAISSTKRKKLAEVIEFSESEISEFLDTDDDLMEVDGLSDELDADIKPEPVVQNSAKAIHTTTSVSPSAISFIFSLLTSVSDVSDYHHSQGSCSSLKEGETREKYQTGQHQIRGNVNCVAWHLGRTSIEGTFIVFEHRPPIRLS